MSLGKKIPRVTRASWIVRIDHYDKWERRLVTSELSIPSDRHQRARIVSFLLANWRYRSSDRTYTLSPLTFLYTIFDNSPQHRGERLRDASQRSAGICRWRFVDYAFPSRTHQVRLRCPRFRRGVCVCFLNNFHRQHSLNVPPPPRFGPRNRPRNPRPRRVGSSYYFPPFRNLKNNRNEINAKLFQLFNPFDRSDLDTDLSTNLDVSPLLRLFVNELKRVCTYW